MLHSHNYPKIHLLILLCFIVFPSVLHWGAPVWVQYSPTINPTSVYLQAWVIECYFTLMHPKRSIKNLNYPLLGWVVTVILTYFHKPFCSNCLDLTYVGMFIYIQGFDPQPVHSYYPCNLLKTWETFLQKSKHVCRLFLKKEKI